jgi:hypothetical protein
VDSDVTESSAERGAAREPEKEQADLVAEFRWKGHWEVWGSEWGGARWVWD